MPVQTQRCCISSPGYPRGRAIMRRSYFDLALHVTTFLLLTRGGTRPIPYIFTFGTAQLEIPYAMGSPSKRHRAGAYTIRIHQRKDTQVENNTYHTHSPAERPPVVTSATGPQ